MEFELEIDNAIFADTQIPEKYENIHLQIEDGNQLTYNDFFTKYMRPNQPCLITNITNKWKCTENWLIQKNENDNTVPNIEYLCEKYGDCSVTVYDCNETYYNSHKTENMSFAEYINTIWSDPTQIKYLKDWHLKLQCPEDDFYCVPIYFASDWLNEYALEHSDDDYRFVYMGRKGTWTPIHVDVFNSYSWSANILGRKKWYLIPPGQEASLRSPQTATLPHNIIPELEKNPHIQYLEIIQDSGDGLFVPSGWYHQVENLQDTISINHNWLNACNIDKCLKSMQDYQISVRREISDCAEMIDFNEQCQTILKTLYGMNYQGFLAFLQFIWNQRLSLMQIDSSKMICNPQRKFHHDNYSMGRNHLKFDLNAVENVLRRLLGNDDFSREKIEELLQMSPCRNTH